MAEKKPTRRSDRTRRSKKPLDEPERLSPIPAAAPSEEPQVDEELPPDEKREYRKDQQDQEPNPPMINGRSFRTISTVYIACAVSLAIAGALAHVLGQKMLDSMVQLMGALVVPLRP